MNYPFVSAEIRWFSKDVNRLRGLFMSLPQEGLGVRDTRRTDHYLRCGLLSTGVKVREGNHEIKMKTGSDELIEIGRIEHWAKWSSSEDPRILDTIDKAFLNDWIEVVKLRSEKNYEITGHKTIRRVGDIFIPEGCGVEFTELYIPSMNTTIYTFGLEGFSQCGTEGENLMLTIEQLQIGKFKFLCDLASYGYPEMLSQFDK